jgi:hypothetical protein
VKVHPLGYSASGTENRIQELMADERVLLIDTRLAPRSWRKGWSEHELREKWETRYHPAGKYLGNINYKRFPGLIKLANPDLGIRGLVMYLREGHDLILLCECGSYDICHRRVIVEELLKVMPEVEVIQSSTTIKCLSVRQPFASWLSNPQWFHQPGYVPKRIENRDWQTAYRGPLLIHASKSFEEDAIWYWEQHLPPSVSRRKEDYPLGALIGITELADIVEEIRDPWFVGDYGWILADARPLDPIPYKGALRLFDVPRAVVGIQSVPLR